MPVDVIAAEVLLIKENYHFIVSVTHYCSSKSKRHILSLGRVGSDDSITDLIVVRSLGGLLLAPVGEALEVQL